MAKRSHDDMILQHGEVGASYIQTLSQIQRTSLNVRKATIAKALLNALYKGVLSEEWLKEPLHALELIETKAEDYPDDYKIIIRRLDTGRPLGPGNWTIQGIKIL